MKRLLFVVLMTFCSLSWAEWEITGRTKKGTFYYDKSTIRIESPIAKMWAMMDFSEELTNSSGERSKSQKVFRVANCKEQTVTTNSIIQFSDSMGEGNVVSTYTIKEGEWTWQPISPGSIAETEWKIMCGKR
jgi:hypothetical protein